MPKTTKEITLQEGYKKGRKRGWAVCEGCGITFNFNDTNIVKNHIENNECKKELKFLSRIGIKLGE